MTGTALVLVCFGSYLDGQCAFARLYIVNGRICIIPFGKEDTSGVRFVMWSCRRRSCTSAGSEDLLGLLRFSV